MLGEGRVCGAYVGAEYILVVFSPLSVSVPCRPAHPHLPPSLPPSHPSPTFLSLRPSFPLSPPSPLSLAHAHAPSPPPFPSASPSKRQPLNIVLYNVLGVGGDSSLYGVEPWWFYLVSCPYPPSLYLVSCPYPPSLETHRAPSQ